MLIVLIILALIWFEDVNKPKSGVKSSLRASRKVERLIFMNCREKNKKY